MMNIITGRNEMRKTILALLAKGKTIGFVPTMGALHQGHLRLVDTAKKENDFAVVSIFVNPTQFNNTEDLDKYPRNLEADIKKLEAVNCDFLFAPSVDEMYPKGEKQLDFYFGSLTKVMEGKNRPGHFDGVALVVYKLFYAIPANNAYFGKKDYQQLLVIKSLVQQLNLNVEIKPCEIVREKDGLAMSSRNQRLTPQQRAIAPIIYKTLIRAAEMAENADVEEVKSFVAAKINSIDDMQLEYFEFADADTLKLINHFEKNKKTMGFIVVNLGTVRLIDNIEIF